MRKALARRRATDGLGDMSGDASRLTGLDILDLEVAAVGNRLDALDPECFHGSCGHWGQQPHVENLVADVLLGDQFMLHVDRELDVVADADAPVIGAITIRFAGSIAPICAASKSIEFCSFIIFIC